jgi:hypothetical protein
MLYPEDVTTTGRTSHHTKITAFVRRSFNDKLKALNSDILEQSEGQSVSRSMSFGTGRFKQQKKKKKKKKKKKNNFD